MRAKSAGYLAVALLVGAALSPGWTQTDTTAGAGLEQSEADGEAALATAGAADWRGDRPPFGPPEITREGFEPRQITALSIDDLSDAEVYDVNDNNLGEVDDIIVGGDGQLQHIVFDVGGFLGIGSRQVAVGFDEVTILSAQNESGFRIYVDATEDQLRDMAGAAAETEGEAETD